MKPWLTPLGLSLCLPVAVPLTVGALVPDAQQLAPAPEPLVAVMPAPSGDRVWVRIREAISNEDLANRLAIAEENLARLNNVDEDHRYDSGAWIALPSQLLRTAKQIDAVDTTDPRRTPPPTAAEANAPSTVVRFGDTVFNIAQRYGLTLAELLRLNPGLETARLVVGSPIRVAQSSSLRPRMVLGLRPVGSGGLSWPELPDFGEGSRDPATPQPHSETGWIWPTQGVFTSGYGWRWGRMHKGIDVANNVGTTVVAAKAGRIAFSGWHDGGYGYLVTIQHPDGSRSLYAHNSRLLVREGEEVNQGQAISQMGSTGRSTGPHLHFEIHPPESGAANPLNFLPPRA